MREPDGANGGFASQTDRVTVPRGAFVEPRERKKMASTGGAGTCGGTAGRKQASLPDDVQYVQKDAFGKRPRGRNGRNAPLAPI